MLRHAGLHVPSERSIMCEMPPQLEIVRPLSSVVAPSMVTGAVTNEGAAVLISGWLELSERARPGIISPPDGAGAWRLCGSGGVAVLLTADATAQTPTH